MTEEPMAAAEEARENVNEQTVLSPPAGIPGDDGAVGDEVAAAATVAFPGTVFRDSAGQAVLYVPREQWTALARWLRDEQGFEMCVDVCAVDHLLNPARPLPPGVTPERFEVVANFLSLSRNRRLRAITQVPASDPTVTTLTVVYPGTDWPEREAYDLFGIRFEGHPDLARILLPDDWEGWPLRKDDAPARVPVQFKGAATTPFQQARREGTP